MIGSKRSYATLHPDATLPEYAGKRNSQIKNERRAANRVARASRKRNR